MSYTPIIFYLSSPYDSKRVKVDIFPNPTEDFVYVNFDSEVSLQNITLLDNVGKTIRNIAGVLNKLEYDIDLTSLLPGVYFINIQTELGNEVKKIIKH